MLISNALFSSSSCQAWAKQPQVLNSAAETPHLQKHFKPPVNYYLIKPLSLSEVEPYKRLQNLLKEIYSDKSNKVLVLDIDCTILPPRFPMPDPLSKWKNLIVERMDE
ncbi:MAG TPA: hypothetical protein V6C96_03250, partial [Vampirovibrionales bacterium]